jgi:hypothetical protein
VSRSRATDEIDTLISDVSTTSTDIAIASGSGSSFDVLCASGSLTPGVLSTSVVTRYRARPATPGCAHERPRGRPRVTRSR